VATDQQDWVDHLELAEFCYNNLEHLAMGATPFQMVMSKSPIVPTTWVKQPASDASDASEELPMVTQLDEERWHLWEMTKANLGRHTRGTKILRIINTNFNHQIIQIFIF
jgi:hypothetical protein